MGLFDFFKKKDGPFYLDRARKSLSHQRWVAARDDAREGLALSGLPESVQAELREVLIEANRALCQLNMEEAERSLASREYARALECLETARVHAPDADWKEKVEALATKVKESKAQASQKVEVLAPGEWPSADEEGEEDGQSDEELDEAFQAYLAGLTPEVAEIYGNLGRGFAAAYVAMNAGDPRPMLELGARLKPVNEEQQALLAFEQARALLMVQQPEQALVLLDVAAAIRGSAPIFLTDHPNIAYLRFEALAMQNRIEEGAAALEEGLQARPDHNEMRLTLASVYVALQRFDEAEPLLSKSISCNKGDPQVHVLRAQLFMGRGDQAGAVQALEAGIKSCGCGPSSLPHPMLARSLADLYLTLEQQPDRVETLLSQLFRAQKGEGEWVDYFLKARYLKWQGDEELARASWKMALGGLPPGDPRREHVESLFG